MGLAGSAFIPSDSSTVYAQWAAIATYSISFSANGATGSIVPISGEVNSSIVLPTVTGLSNSGLHLLAGIHSPMAAESNMQADPRM